jgi:hypothetical protein
VKLDEDVEEAQPVDVSEPVPEPKPVLTPKEKNAAYFRKKFEVCYSVSSLVLK